MVQVSFKGAVSDFGERLFLFVAAIFLLRYGSPTH